LVVDQDRIVQVLINLISNAVKYSPAGATVKVTCALATQRRVRFSVADLGPGIPQEGISKLFHKFQQVQSDTSIQQEGTGLGLAISKMIVSHHRGDIGVDSECGKGSTFWFELPGLDDDQEETS
jgi:signal transduction histidine kinase